jgi:hypothetical protein
MLSYNLAPHQNYQMQLVTMVQCRDYEMEGEKYHGSILPAKADCKIEKSLEKLEHNHTLLVLETSNGSKGRIFSSYSIQLG